MAIFTFLVHMFLSNFSLPKIFLQLRFLLEYPSYMLEEMFFFFFHLFNQPHYIDGIPGFARVLDSALKYNGKKVIEIKLGFWDSVLK